jgi:hypothetical protein
MLNNTTIYFELNSITGNHISTTNDNNANKNKILKIIIILRIIRIQ